MNSVRRDGVAQVELVLQRQIIHRQVNAVEIAAGDVDVAGLGASAAEDDGVEITPQVFDLDVLADVGVGDEVDPLGFHDLHAADRRTVFPA